MKELFRERDYTRVGYCQSILEEEGIATLVRNKDLVGSLTEVPIPEFYPALCVMEETDYDRALEILKQRMCSDAEKASIEWQCQCGESNPGNFEVCWSCNEVDVPDPPAQYSPVPDPPAPRVPDPPA